VRHGRDVAHGGQGRCGIRVPVDMQPLPVLAHRAL